MKQGKSQSFRVANRRQIISMEGTEDIEPTKTFIIINASSSRLFSCDDDDDDNNNNNNNNNNHFW